MLAAYICDSLVGRGLDAQRKEIRNWLNAEKVDTDSVNWYEDGLENGRPTKSGIEALSQAIHSGKVGQVVVWKLDRLGRSTRQVISLLSDWLEQDVSIASVGQDICIQGGHSSLGQFLSALNEIEVAAHAEGEAQAIIHAKKKEVAKRRHVERAERQREEVWDLYNAGMSVPKIAEKLGISMDKVSNYLIIC